MLVGPGFGGLPYDLALARPEWMFIQRTYSYLASVGILGLALLFPNGRLAPRWSLWPLLYLLVILFPNAFMYGSRFDIFTWPIGFTLVGFFCIYGSINRGSALPLPALLFLSGAPAGALGGVRLYNRCPWHHSDYVDSHCPDALQPQ
jgi:hypothetical protein